MERDHWKTRTPSPPADDARPKDDPAIEPPIEPAGPESNYGLHPFEVMRRYSREMERMFEGLAGARWPALEVFDRDDQRVVRAELPGMKREDVHVRVVGNTLVIEGERRADGERTSRSEWRYGRFSREIPIASELDSSRLTARMSDGVLELSLPYREARRAREIRIEDGEPSGTRH
jgi:HSP20 family protein